VFLQRILFHCCGATDDAHNEGRTQAVKLWGYICWLDILRYSAGDAKRLANTAGSPLIWARAMDDAAIIDQWISVTDPTPTVQTIENTSVCLTFALVPR
jgi:hypothetical protein